LPVLPPALRRRDFRLFWGGLAVSSIGSQFTIVAMAWQIYQLTNSPLQLGVLGLARAIPQMTVALLGGVLADRVDRRRILIVTQFTQFFVSGSLVALTVTGAMTPAFLYAASVGLALSTALETPARQATVPNLVDRHELTSALALNSTLRDVGLITGPALAGVLLAVSGPASCYAIDAASWLVMLSALLRIAPQVPAAGRAAESIFRSLHQGFQFIWTHPVILSLMTLDFAATFFGSARALYPIYARDILRVGAPGLGVLFAASAIGSGIGAAVMSTIGQVKRAGLWVLIGVAVYGVCTIAFALSPIFWFSVLMLAGTGLGNMISAVLRGTINQMSTPNELRGRVAAVNSIFTSGGPQLGQFESGVLAQVASTQVSALSGGVATLLVVAALLPIPWIRKFEFGQAGESAAIASS
jgi:MFS family permease